MTEFEPQQITPPPVPPFPTIIPTPVHGPGAVFTPNLDRGRLYLIWLFQTAVSFAAIALFWRIGVTPWFWVTGCGVFWILCAGLGWLMWQNAATPEPLAPRSCLLWHMKAGVWLTATGIASLALAVALRIKWAESLLAGSLICGFLLTLSVTTLVTSRYAIRHQSTPWLQFSVGVTVVPLLIAWTAASITASSYKVLYHGGVTSAVLELSRAAEFARRQMWSEHRGWRKPDGKPIVIAVGLSGGGYRAATVHAGLLAALDEHCVPIRYLSTVSGGSIVGAHYALGYTPALFEQTLIATRPRLPDDMLAIWFVLADWFVPFWNSADTYAWHFARTFFGSKRIGDTTSTPLLIVNATDLENATHPREVFFVGRDSRHRELDETALAEVVAASGAFPGAFQPKKIPWVTNNGMVVPRRFIDAGVVENFGYAGLAAFLWLKKDLPKPDVLIIGDASAGLTADSLPPKVGLLDLLIRSENISYEIQHNLLRSNLAHPETRYERLQMKALIIRAHDEEARLRLANEPFRSTLVAAKAVVLPGATAVDDVAKYRTLKELDSLEVEKAFWVGQTLGRQWWREINAERDALGASGPECPAR